MKNSLNLRMALVQEVSGVWDSSQWSSPERKVRLKELSRWQGQLYKDSNLQTFHMRHSAYFSRAVNQYDGFYGVSWPELDDQILGQGIKTNSGGE